MRKKFTPAVFALFLLMFLFAASACGTSPVQNNAQGGAQNNAQDNTQNSAPDNAKNSDDEENYSTGDAKSDNPLNQDGIGEKELLVVSFGTSYNDSRRLCIGAIENSMAEAFPDWSVRRAFTSKMVISHIEKRDGIKIDNLDEALKRASDNGVKTLVIQPTLLMNGVEYEEIQKAAAPYAASGSMKVSIGEPLLSGEADFAKVADALKESTSVFNTEGSAVCFMGHGTEASSNEVYARMQQTFKEKGFDNYFIATVEAEPNIDNLKEMLRSGVYKKVVLQPMMVVAGDHANNDMAGDGEDSWKSILTKEGYEVEAVLKGLGELSPVRDIYVEHAKAAMDGSK